jgi:exopolysaccharide biosynthesis polyprenyl glycosylphosphotransferase
MSDVIGGGRPEVFEEAVAAPAGVKAPPVGSGVLEAGWTTTLARTHGRRDYLLRRALALSDALAITGALAVAFAAVGVRGAGDLLWLLPALPAWVVLFSLYGLYTRDVKRISQGVLDDVPPLFHAFVIGGLAMWAYFRVLPVHQLVFAEMLLFGVGGGILVLALRHLVRRGMPRLLGPERVVLIGDSPAWKALIQKIRAHPEYALEPVGKISRNGGPEPRSLQMLGSVDDPALDRILERHGVERVILAQDDVGDEVMLRLLRQCGRLKVKVSVLPRRVKAMGPSMEVDDIEGLTVLGLNPLVLPRSARLAKRAVDVVGSGLGLLLLSPLMALIAAAIKLDSKGPVLFKQPRVGAHGRTFSLLKFRTMVPDAQSRTAELMARSTDAHWLKLDDDPRVTRMGRMLRRTSLDELPQLWNVLVGSMSLVGPRPLTPSDHDQIEGWGGIRLDLSPGITGLWQVLGRTKIPFEEMVTLDYVYVTNWSLWTDIKLLLRTTGAVLSGRGAN